MLTKLNSMFNKRYGQQIADLNLNVYKSAAQDDGSFDVPVVTLGGGGGTVLNNNDATNLKPPAIARIVNKRMKPFHIIYRVALSFEEATIASNKPEYFNYLFDALVPKALGNYKATVGGEDKVRFGSHYIAVKTEADMGEIFRILHGEDGNDFVEFRFTGSWASEEEAV